MATGGPLAAAEAYEEELFREPERWRGNHYKTQKKDDPRSSSTRRMLNSDFPFRRVIINANGEVEDFAVPADAGNDPTATKYKFAVAGSLIISRYHR